MEQRIHRLEQSLKAHRLLLLMVIAVFVVMGFRQEPGEVKAKTLVIANEEGKTTALFYGTKEGFEGVVYGRATEDAEFQPALRLEGGRTGGQIDLFDEDGRKVVELTRGVDGGVVTIFNSQTRQPVASVNAYRDRGARIELNDTSGTERVFVESDPSGGVMKMILPRGIPALSMYSLVEGGFLALYDEKGDTVQSLPKRD